jgi:HAE1 family hydrophobic/amphiphilic exporter-1
LNFQPPAVPGYGAAGGFEPRWTKQVLAIIKKMETVNTDFVKEIKRPELASVFSFYSASFRYMMKIDNDIAQQKGVTH